MGSSFRRRRTEASLSRFDAALRKDKNDILLIKTDSKGFELWNVTFGEPEYDYASSVQRTNDDGYILAGTKTPGGSDSTDLWLIKTDALAMRPGTEPLEVGQLTRALQFWRLRMATPLVDRPCLRATEAGTSADQDRQEERWCGRRPTED